MGVNMDTMNIEFNMDINKGMYTCIKYVIVDITIFNVDIDIHLIYHDLCIPG